MLRVCGGYSTTRWQIFNSLRAVGLAADPAQPQVVDAGLTPHVLPCPGPIAVRNRAVRFRLCAIPVCRPRSFQQYSPIHYPNTRGYYPFWCQRALRPRPGFATPCSRRSPSPAGSAEPRDSVSRTGPGGLGLHERPDQPRHAEGDRRSSQAVWPKGLHLVSFHGARNPEAPPHCSVRLQLAVVCDAVHFLAWFSTPPFVEQSSRRRRHDRTSFGTRSFA